MTALSRISMKDKEPSAQYVRALLAVADPTNWPPTQPASIDLPGKVERARAALGYRPTMVLPAPWSGARATRASIVIALQEAPPSATWLPILCSSRKQPACGWSNPIEPVRR
jgi:hypothetical protein